MKRCWLPGAGMALSVVLACSSEPSGGEPTDGSGANGSLGAGGHDGSGGSGTSASGGDAREGRGGSSGESDGGQSTGGTSQSLGCGEEVSQQTGAWVEQPQLTVERQSRRFWTRLPAGYDSGRTYPLIFLFHDCGDETRQVPIETEIGGEAILVRGLAEGQDGCWSTETETDLLFFDQMLDTMKEETCVDQTRVFAVGYGSGAFLLSRLGCERAYRLDGIATVAGGNALPEGTSCTGPVPTLLIHDEDDMENDISGSQQVRERLIEQNFCVLDGVPESVDPEPCVSHTGCGDPLLWCQTSGQGHTPQGEFAGPLIRDFFEL